MFIEAGTSTLTLADPWERAAASQLARFADIPAANVADVFDRLLVMDSGISPLTRRTRMVGTALPILTRAGDNLAIHRALDDAQPGDILVIAGQADLSRALIGDLIGEIMKVKGVRGAVIDGVARDADVLDSQGLAIFGRGLTPAGPFKNGPGVVGFPVACGGVVVGPGDLIVADADGVTCVPVDRIDWAATQAREVIAKEDGLRSRIAASAVS